jgi:CheY-like chemotaxis protein
MLCDLNMPAMDGFAVLGWLSAHPECRVIPTIMFSSSAQDSDIHRSYLAGANAYLQKPTSPERFAEDIAALVEFWSRAQVPPLPPGEKCGEG